MPKTNTKFALYKYTTENVGDDIQSIAARRFLPRVDYYINRDRVGAWKNKNPQEIVKLIANGWYMHAPYSWPIKDPTIDPLYISMYTEQFDPGVVSRFLSKESKTRFKKFGKVGARDENTHAFFSKNDIDSYISRCVTLTLQADKDIKKQDIVLLVDVSKEVYDFVRKSTKKRIIYLTNAVNPLMEKEQRDELAELHLYLYQAAHCVVTERLHAALPCLALETPVLLLKKSEPVGGNVDRLGGLGELCHYYTEDEFLESGVYDINNPPKNSSEYIIHRNQLIETCKKFTDFNNAKTFSWLNIGSMPLDEVLARMDYIRSEGLRTSATGYIRSGQQIELMHKEIEQLHSRVSQLTSEIEQLHSRVSQLTSEIEQFNSIRISARKLLSNTKRQVISTYRKL